MFILKHGLDGLLYPQCTRVPWEQTVDQLILCGRVKACLGLFGGLLLVAFLSVGVLQNKKNKQRLVHVMTLGTVFLAGCVLTVAYVNLSAASTFETYRLARQDMHTQGFSVIQIAEHFQSPRGHHQDHDHGSSGTSWDYQTRHRLY
jgi:hypothetical protein